MAGLGPMPHQQPVRRPPRVVVRRAELARERRPRRHLAPEEAVDVDVFVAGRTREHPVDDEQIREAVVVEIERVGRPRPPSELGARLQRDVLERAVASVAKQGVAARVSLVERANVGRRLWHEPWQRRHAQSGGRPHVAGVDVEVPVVVVVDKGGAHAGAVVLDAGALGDVLEAHLAVDDTEIAVEILAPEVVSDEQVGPAVLVEVAPRRGEAEAVVVLVQADGVGDLDEVPVPVVVEQHIGGPVLCVVVGRRRAGLVLAGADQERVGAEVEVHEAVAIVIGRRDGRQRAA